MKAAETRRDLRERRSASSRGQVALPWKARTIQTRIKEKITRQERICNRIDIVQKLPEQRQQSPGGVGGKGK
jgi:hypothetical protein